MGLFLPQTPPLEKFFFPLLMYQIWDPFHISSKDTGEAGKVVILDGCQPVTQWQTERALVFPLPKTFPWMGIIDQEKAICNPIHSDGGYHP